MHMIKSGSGLTMVELAIVLMLLVLLIPVARYMKNDTNLQYRAIYALRQTDNLREKVAGFHNQHQRWPSASEIGLTESTTYPDGGGYRLQPDGSIVVTFAVVPELKGRSIYIRPVVSNGGKGIAWKCTADPEIPKHFYSGC